MNVQLKLKIISIHDLDPKTHLKYNKTANIRLLFHFQ